MADHTEQQKKASRNAAGIFFAAKNMRNYAKIQISRILKISSNNEFYPASNQVQLCADTRIGKNFRFSKTHNDVLCEKAHTTEGQKDWLRYFKLYTKSGRLSTGLLY